MDTKYDMLSVNEAAEVLGVAPITIRRYINKGDLPAYKVKGRIRMYQDDVRKLEIQAYVPRSAR